ncbi:MAG: hypothetical protein M3R52_06070 [Acidobacteriota bacterium]|nr:hypothetical protein [Acidobacteriota bacterium]
MRRQTKALDLEDELRPEYDFSKMRIVARGPKRKAPKAKIVYLEPDVANAFPDKKSVNATLPRPGTPAPYRLRRSK